MPNKLSYYLYRCIGCLIVGAIIVLIENKFNLLNIVLYTFGLYLVWVFIEAIATTIEKRKAMSK